MLLAKQLINFLVLIQTARATQFVLQTQQGNLKVPTAASSIVDDFMSSTSSHLKSRQLAQEYQSTSYESIHLMHMFHHNRRSLVQNPFGDDYGMDLHDVLDGHRILAKSEPTIFMRADFERPSSNMDDGKQSAGRYYDIKVLHRLGKNGKLEMVPDPYDNGTLISFVEMCWDSYIDRSSPTWEPVEGFPSNISVGWDSDGLRGYVFGSEQVLVVAIKGTSTSFFGVGSGPTSKRDKYEDNLMFSCCCAAVDRSWWPICPCASSGTSCDLTCFKETAGYADSYLNIATKIYNLLRQLYPSTPIWFTGHSLGGAISGMVAAQFGAPAITFEAPGDRLFAEKMGWAPTSGSEQTRDIWHFGMSTDPIFTGECTGTLSACYIAGYALESRCHMGHSCLIDYPWMGTPNKTDIRSHRLQYVMDTLKQVTSTGMYEPFCLFEPPCSDCAGWEFGQPIIH